MTGGVAIRPCRSDECAGVLDLWKEAEATPSATDRLEELVRLVSENGDLFLVAEDNGRLVGTVIGGWDGWRGNIYRLAVLPEYRRRGVGRALIQEAERRLSAKHALAMSFWDSLSDMGYQRDPRMVRYVKIL
jgi:ribosomal protein S18 acetylase RimI-like enzyme